MKVLRADHEVSLLSTRELTICRSLEIGSRIHKIIKHGDCFSACSSRSRATKSYERHSPPNTPVNNLKKESQNIDKR